MKFAKRTWSGPGRCKSGDRLSITRWLSVNANSIPSMPARRPGKCWMPVRMAFQKHREGDGLGQKAEGEKT